MLSAQLVRTLLMGSMCFSNGTVSSTIMTALAGADQSRISGCRAVMLTSAGNFRWRSRSAANRRLPPCDSRDHSILVQSFNFVPGLENWIHFWTAGRPSLWRCSSSKSTSACLCEASDFLVHRLVCGLVYCFVCIPFVS
ncbi:hypothetical protein XENOCAPTIV_020430 [Xenoophorus captivus]|uniref:Secreted protein n=1 Tax=Xenoophorus captivus TaxID=1517983 RepID=A0ABV0QXK4_9TELE